MEISNNILLSDINSKDIRFKYAKEKDRFDEFMENQEKEKAQKKETEKLLEDLNYVAKTGFTKQELEAIQRKFEELQEKRAKNGYTPKNMKEALAIQKANLEQAIYEVTGKKVSLDEENLQSWLQGQNRDKFESISTNENLSLLAKTKK